MNLVIPSIGLEPGPDWASDVNASLTILDQHDHSPGHGTTIPPSGININSDLSFNNNNLIQARSLRMFVQSAALGLVSDIGCLYVTGVDLYYNDVSGNQIQITAAGGVAGTPGSIGGLTAPASATYVPLSSTFVWQSNVNTPANMDFASAILRNLTVSSFGLTLNPPSAMGANFSITLPTLPATQKILTLDNSGNMGAVYDVDNVTIEIVSNNLQVKDGSITTAKLATGAAIGNITSGTVTAGLIEPSNAAQSANSGLQVYTSGTFAQIGFSVTITTHGRPVIAGMQAIAGAGLNGYIEIYAGAAGSFQLRRDGTTIAYYTFYNNSVGSGANMAVTLPPTLDVSVPAGVHTYAWFAARAGAAVPSIQLDGQSTVAYELY